MSANSAKRGLGRRNLSLYVSSAIAAILIAPGAAQAACTPNPAQQDGTTNCTDTETSQVVVNRFGVDVVVAAGATVAAPDATSSILVTTPLSADNVGRSNSLLQIDGTVRGGTRSAIAVVPDYSGYGYTLTSHIIVSETGRIEGPVGITVGLAPPNPYIYGSVTTVSLDNSGSIRSEGSNYAVRTADGAEAWFEQITNRAGGTIGAIRANVGTLTNEGVIDGGNLSAYSEPFQRLYFYYGNTQISNSGTIGSASAAATIALGSKYYDFNDTSINNDGIIVNDGTGAAIASVRALQLTNGSAGTIRSGGTAIISDSALDLTNDGAISGVGDAIRSQGYLTLTNTGSITGDIRTGNAGSMIDTSGGTINGSLLLGDGNDLVVGDSANLSNPFHMVSGAVDAGGGNDTLLLAFREDRVIDGAISLSPTFEQIELQLSGGSTLTLSENFASTTALTLSSDPDDQSEGNRFLLKGRIDTVGPALFVGGSWAPLEVVNSGTIAATLANPRDSAIYFSSANFENSGSIVARGGNAFGSANYGAIINSGSIEADRTAVGGSLILTNSGSIRSVLGTAVDLRNSPSGFSENSGTIDGAVAGVYLSGSRLRNSGTISGGGSGVQLGFGATFENLAGGVVNRGVFMQSPNPYSYFTGGNRVINSGTINGSVAFGSLAGINGNSNTFIAASGGVVKGDLIFGTDGDIFATYMTNDGPGFYGVTGRVLGTGRQALRYLVDEDSTATPELRGPFSRLGYDLANGATLTLSTTATLNHALGFSGQGSVVLTADMANLSSQPPGVLLHIGEASVRLAEDGSSLTNAVNVTSRGHLITSLNPASYYSYSSGVLVSSGGTFTNAGRITALTKSDYGPNYNFVAIRNDNGTVINNGLIELDGSTGIQNAYFDGKIINNGSIVQLADGVRSIGIVGAGDIVNTGIVNTDGEAIITNYGATVRNTGSIRSNGASAIVGDAMRIVNESGGLIAGQAGGNAIQVGRGSIVSNAGTIDGNVRVNGYYSGASAYFNRGGTLNGDLTLTDYDDLFVALNGEVGVSGTIDTGAGVDTFVFASDRSNAVNLSSPGALPAGFERVGFGIYGADTVLSLSSIQPYGNALLLVGDGSVVSDASIIGNLSLGSTLDPQNLFGIGSTLSLTNEGSIMGGISGNARAIHNKGFIQNVTLPAVALNVTGDFVFSNSGTITGTGSEQSIGRTVSIRQTSQPQPDNFAFANSGTIVGRTSLVSDASQVSVENSGQILDGEEPYVGTLFLGVGSYYQRQGVSVNSQDVALTNSGTISRYLSAALAAERVTIVNSGTIGGGNIYDGMLIDQVGQLFGYYGYSYDRGDQESFSLTNSGVVNGGAELSAQAATINIVNSGTIRSEKADGEAALSLAASSYGTQAIDIANSGSIIADQAGLSGVIVRKVEVDAYFNTDPRDGGDTSISLVNSGAIRADAGAVYVPARTSLFPDYYSDEPAALYATFGVGIDATYFGFDEYEDVGFYDGGTVSIRNEAGGIISAIGAPQPLKDISEFDQEVYGLQPGYEVPSSLASIGSIAVGVAAKRFSLDNAGLIHGSAGGAIDADTRVMIGENRYLLPGTYVAGAIQTLGSIDSIINRETGVIIGSVDLGDMDDDFVNLGAVTGDIYLRDGDDRLTNGAGATITGNVAMGAGKDRVTLLGSVSGDIDLGEGDDELVLDAAWAIGGKATGGEGTDIVQIGFSGSDAAPQQRDLSNIEAFEQLQVLGGVGALSGTAVFPTVDVRNGRLIGLAGSTISGNITVQQGAVFGSAGTVNGNVDVSGTLSPGASPGTMTVNGNVMLNAGSNSVFELTPTVTDALVVNGGLTIADGAKLTLTGRAIPGIRRLITASDGVNGSFGSNVTFGSGTAGVVRYTAGGIDLYSLFQTRPNTGGPVGTITDTLNRLLLDNRATPAILAAFPALVDSEGYASAAAISTLSAEPYASVAQVGIENGLAISQALRGSRLAGLADSSGLFVFGQAYGHWRSFDADRRGAANAAIDSSGYLGGVGYGNSTLGAALFVGRSDSKQQMRSLGARNDADGLFFGGRVHYANGGLSAGVSVVFDRAKADTVRNPVVGGTSRGHYDLHGTTLDGWLAYDVSFANDWRIGPQIGVTHVSVKRDGVRENGGSFALDVARQRYDATFLTGDLKLATPTREGLRSWVAAGVRHRLSSDAVTARASFVGTGTSYALLGAERRKTLPHLGAGIDFAASSNVSLFLNGDAEFDGRNDARQVNGGIIFRF